MHIKPAQLIHQLKKKVSPIYTLHGNEPLLLNEAADLIRTAAKKFGYSERHLFSVDSRFNWSEIHAATTNQSLFNDRKLIEIRIPSGKPRQGGGQTIERFCTAPPPDTITLIMLPKIDKKNLTAKWFKALERSGTVVVINSIERKDLPQWLKQRLALQQQTADTNTLQFLADRVEGNLLAAHQEIQKLALLYPSGTLSYEQIKEAVLNVSRYDVYQLSEAMITMDTVRFSHILNGLKEEGTAPPLILAVLAEQIRMFIRIHYGLSAGKSMNLILKEARVWGKRQQAISLAVKHFDRKSLELAILHAGKIDRINKGITKGNVWDELMQLGLRFTANAAG